MQVGSPDAGTLSPNITQQQLLELGTNQLAYVKLFTQEEARHLATQMAEPAPDITTHPYWGLYNADGELFAISDDREQLLWVAMENRLMITWLN